MPCLQLRVAYPQPQLQPQVPTGFTMRHLNNRHFHSHQIVQMVGRHQKQGQLLWVLPQLKGTLLLLQDPRVAHTAVPLPQEVAWVHLQGVMTVVIQETLQVPTGKELQPVQCQHLRYDQEILNCVLNVLSVTCFSRYSRHYKVMGCDSLSFRSTGFTL